MENKKQLYKKKSDLKLMIFKQDSVFKSKNMLDKLSMLLGD